MIAVLAAVAVLGAECPDLPDRPDCMSVPTAEAAAALQCIDADLPRCELMADADRRTSEAVVEELRTRLEAERRRADALDKLLDRCTEPEPPAWYERPWFVASVSVVATVAVVVAARQ